MIDLANMAIQRVNQSATEALEKEKVTIDNLNQNTTGVLSSILPLIKGMNMSVSVNFGQIGKKISSFTADLANYKQRL